MKNTNKNTPPLELPKGRGANRAYATHEGAYYVGDSLELLQSKKFEDLKGKVQLLLTSPPLSA